MAKAVKQPEVDDDVQHWLKQIKIYEREFKKWEGRVEKILKRYRDEWRNSGSGNTLAKFNILWSNVQTLVPAVYSRTPEPDVSRRFKDNDPVGRVASLLLERALDFEVQHYPDYRDGLKNVVYDRFLGGRGQAWVRYEPHMKTVEVPTMPPDGVQVTEDAEAEQETESMEVLDYECAPVDYVHWRNFGHTIARTWEEVTAVWRGVYMGRDALVERFGEELGNKIPLDTCPEELRKMGKSSETEKYQALIYEIWDKDDRKVYWLSKSMTEMLDEKDDPLKLDGFFPCPKPLYATLTSDSLVPVPDFILYQDQANSLDILCDRIDGLVKALQVKGVYNSALPELARLFTEGENNSLIPVKDWMSFSEKMGLRGAIDLVELKPIYEALVAAYQAMEQVKGQIYEITGISDIIRGQTDPNETLGAQQMKGRFVGMRLRTMQLDVARFATELLQIKAQIIGNLFDPKTIVAISGAAQLMPVDQQLIPQALQLVKQNTLREFRVEVAAESLVQMDEAQEQQARVEFVGGLGDLLEKALPAVLQAPQLTPLIMESIKFLAASFKAGRTFEGKLDEIADQLAQAAATPKPPPPPDPKAQAQMAKAQVEMQTAPIHAQAEQTRAQADVVGAQADLQKAIVEHHTTALQAQMPMMPQGMPQ